jgi:hypothetical protein
MREGGQQVIGHAWVVVDGRPIHDAPEFLEDLVPFIAFDADGRPVEPAEN